MLEGLAIRISLFHFIAVKTEAEVENTLLQVKKKKKGLKAEPLPKLRYISLLFPSLYPASFSTIILGVQGTQLTNIF